MKTYQVYTWLAVLCWVIFLILCTFRIGRARNAFMVLLEAIFCFILAIILKL